MQEKAVGKCLRVKVEGTKAEDVLFQIVVRVELSET